MEDRRGAGPVVGSKRERHFGVALGGGHGPTPEVRYHHALCRVKGLGDQRAQGRISPKRKTRSQRPGGSPVASGASRSPVGKQDTHREAPTLPGARNIPLS